MTLPKICLTGVESTGKSMLAPHLAKTFGGVVVDEFGRSYAEHHGTDFSVQSLIAIADGQIAACAAATALAPRLIIEDTDIVMTCAWAEMLFGGVHPYLHAIPASADLYLLFDADVPWIDDGTRMFGDKQQRQRFDQIIRAELRRRHITPVEIHGDWQQRRAQAITAIDQYMRGIAYVAGKS